MKEDRALLYFNKVLKKGRQEEIKKEVKKLEIIWE